MGNSTSNSDIISVVVDSVEVCSQCSEDKHGVLRCDKCNDVVCSDCCPHQPSLKNSLYGIHLEIASVEKVRDEPKQEFKRVRGGCFTHDGKLALLCCYYKRDKKCKCCDITSHWKLCFTDGEENIISDRLHDTMTGRHPGQMTSSISKKMTYMTAPYTMTVYKFSSHKNINEAFKTAGKCYGIACFDNGLAVSVFIDTDFGIAKWQVQYLDFNGNLKKRVTSKQGSSDPLFSSPRYLSSNLSQDTLFVSDDDKCAIFALDVQGHVLFQYTDSKIKTPRGITVDTENNIYVADSNAVVQIEAGGKDSKVILDNRNKSDNVVDVVFEPTAMKLVVIQQGGSVTTFSYRK